MDPTSARIFDFQRRALLRLVAGMFAAVGIAPGGPVAGAAGLCLPRHVRERVLAMLRRAEPAVRRLIVVVAARVSIALPAVRALPGPVVAGEGGGLVRVPGFPLFDTRKNFSERKRRLPPGGGPRVHILDGRPLRIAPVPVPPPPPSPDDRVDASRLGLRLVSLARALGDLPRQARRLARWQARRAGTAFSLRRPMRPGFPPGHRHRARDASDDVLRECHLLALRTLAAPDTS